MEYAESRLVNGWLGYHRASVSNPDIDPPDELFDFVMEVDDLVRKDPNRAWNVIQMILANTRDDIERACLAAGPLEDLLAKHGAELIENVERLAAADALFRELLAGVWRNGISEVIWVRVQRAASGSTT